MIKRAYRKTPLRFVPDLEPQGTRIGTYAFVAGLAIAGALCGLWLLLTGGGK
jgi:hypothetical protein